MNLSARADSRVLIRQAPDPRLWTGVAGIVVAILTLVESSVATFLVGQRPRLDDREALAEFMASASTPTLIVILLDTFLMAFLIVFLAGFRQLITKTRPDIEWIADLAFGAGLVFVGVTLVGDAMEAGAALDSIGAVSDPTVVRALTEGHAQMFGSMGCVLTALVAAAAAHVIFLSGALPRWTGWLAYVVAALNAAAVPTMFAGTNEPTFFSAGGPAIALFATFPWLVWVGSVGVTALRDRRLADRESDAATRR
ncbi:hypothetical protein GCM10027413_23460 [Conyzicola nivalis]|uniref:DUF4386 domain-containing protein n=1 Tax=Conyzicola nivalis TaxID=1477021 RepID=A0A916SDT9_9MICO|nr:hypothetical protein [Conyzicola nivalis]GGA91835.1 hypothetical protein GCM10010979_03160 [Conyzicola nivalis]